MCLSIIRIQPSSFSDWAFLVLIETDLITRKSVDCRQRFFSNRDRIYDEKIARVV